MSKEKIEKLIERIRELTEITDSTEYIDTIVFELLENTQHCVYDLLFSTEKLALSPIDFIEIALNDDFENYNFINNYISMKEEELNIRLQKSLNFSFNYGIKEVDLLVEFDNPFYENAEREEKKVSFEGVKNEIDIEILFDNLIDDIEGMIEIKLNDDDKDVIYDELLKSIKLK